MRVVVLKPTPCNMIDDPSGDPSRSSNGPGASLASNLGPADRDLMQIKDGPVCEVTT